MGITDVTNFIQERLKYVERELVGKRVSKEHGDARRAICDTCPYKGKESIIGITVETCSLCGCLLDVKPYFETHILQGKGTIETVMCPHKEGNKWQEIDLQFLKTKNE